MQPLGVQVSPMNIAVDRIRAETLAKIQDALILMDARLAGSIRNDLEIDATLPSGAAGRRERTAAALDAIREHVSDALGEKAIPTRLIQLWASILFQDNKRRKRRPKPASIRLLK